MESMKTVEQECHMCTRDDFKVRHRYRHGRNSSSSPGVREVLRKYLSGRSSVITCAKTLWGGRNQVCSGIENGILRIFSLDEHIFAEDIFTSTRG